MLLTHHLFAQRASAASTMPVIIPIIALVVSVSALLISGYVGLWRPKQANRVRYWLFAHEAVELHKRWVQFARQVLREGMLSQSRTFEWITFGTVEEFMRTGGDKRVVAAVYCVKKLAFQVSLQIARAQDASAAQRAVISSLPERAADRADTDSAKERVAIEGFRTNLRYIAAFILAKDEWPNVCSAIESLIESAEREGHDMAELRRQLRAQREEGDGLYEEWQLSLR